MQLRIEKKYLLILVATIVLAAGTGVCKYTRLFRLRQVSVVPAEHAEKGQKLGLVMDQNLFRTPIDSAAGKLLQNSWVLRVDIDYALPDGIDIVINDIKPIAVVVGNKGRTLYALDDRCYLLPYDDCTGPVDYPLIIGLEKTKAYKKVNDRRLYMIVDQLKKIKDDCHDFYMALSCVDLSNKDFVSVYFDGLPFRVDLYAGTLYTSIKDLEIFLLDFNPDLSDVARLDLRSEGLIISAG